VYTYLADANQVRICRERSLQLPNTFTKVANLNQQSSLWANSAGRQLLRVCVDGATIRYTGVERGGAQ